jgi:hypothetical protein
MTFEEFVALSPADAAPLGIALHALAIDRANDWSGAHERSSQEETPEANRVHAYLHRKEGALANARYWYDRVGEPPYAGSPDDEWELLVRRFLT